MSLQHNEMARSAARKLLEELRAGKSTGLPAERLTPKSILWTGFIDWPRPDKVIQDSETGSSLAIEFKPPGHERGEYVRGLGQAMTYLKDFEFALLIVPSKSIDGYAIADHLASILDGSYAQNLSIGLMSYDSDPAMLRVHIPIRERNGEIPPARSKRNAFWAYWRELSQYDLYTLLESLDREPRPFKEVYDEYWENRRRAGRALTWEGHTREKPEPGKVNYSSEQTNDQLSLRHTGLIDSDSHITSEGYELLQTGKVYGPGSQAFLLKLAACVLLHGRHLDLIFWVDEIQKQISPKHKKREKQFRRAIDHKFYDAGFIRRLPERTGKGAFTRDEPKLWNKLGLLVRRSPKQYFFRNEGFRFDWRQIVSVLSAAD